MARHSLKMLFPYLPLKLEEKITHGSQDRSLHCSNAWVGMGGPPQYLGEEREDKLWRSACLKLEHVSIET